MDVLRRLSTFRLAAGHDGKLSSGSTVDGGIDDTILVWSGIDGTRLHTLKAHHFIVALAMMRDGTLVSGGGYLGTSTRTRTTTTQTIAFSLL